MTDINTLTVAVVGMGPMGRGIARVFSAAGADVLVADITPELTRRGIETIAAESAADERPVEVRGATLAVAASEADLIVEAIVENMEAKASLLAEVAEHGHAQLIVASNTSSLSIGQMGKEFGDPARLIGTHFFNPPHKMKLVEVVRGAATSEEVYERVVGIIEAVDKSVVTCADTPNFIVNRVCRPLYYEAQLLLMQGLEAATVDAVACGALGHPMGPLTLLDFTGLHTHLASSETALREFGEPKYRPIPIVRGLVRNGMTGRAARRGFYDYSVEKPRDAVARVTLEPPQAGAASLRYAGPDSARLSAHPRARRTIDSTADTLVYSCHRAPTGADLDAVSDFIAQGMTVVVDSSDAGWLDALPPGAEWARIHAMDDPVFVEIVHDEVARITAGPGAQVVVSALQARSARVLALPGLVGDRLANCMANEAFAVVEEGTAEPDDVDTALRLGMNHPRGPFEYVEEAGIGAVYAGLRSLLDSFGDPRYRPTQLMRRKSSAEGSGRP